MLGWFRRLFQKRLPPLSPPNGHWTTIFDSRPGAWQQNVKRDRETVLSYFAVYAVTTLIAGDVGKLRLRLVQQENGIWTEVDRSSPFWPVLRKPNRYQTRQKFIEQWVLSKLLHGNAYVLKQRDSRGIVTAMYVLDPQRVTPLISPDGAVYYQLQDDYLAQVPTGLPAVPASEIIHDTMSCLFHPLVGVSPLFAAGLPAAQGLEIQNNSARFFRNNSQPGGILMAPGSIEEPMAERIKEHWKKNYSGENAGTVAVLGDGLKYERMGVSAVDAQLIDQLKVTADQVCSAFHVPPYKIGVGQMPTYQNGEILSQIYYSDCLQAHIEAIEALLDEGLSLPSPLGTEFDLDELLKMDTSSKVKAAAESIKAGAASPNEARKRWLNLPDTPGGETPFLQEQNWPLQHLASRKIPDRPPTDPAPIESPPENAGDA
ncbi:MAG: phage portal protein [Lautropia sp.]